MAPTSWTFPKDTCSFSGFLSHGTVPRHMSTRNLDHKGLEEDLPVGFTNAVNMLK